MSTDHSFWISKPVVGSRLAFRVVRGFFGWRRGCVVEADPFRIEVGIEEQEPGSPWKTFVEEDLSQVLEGGRTIDEGKVHVTITVSRAAPDDGTRRTEGGAEELLQSLAAGQFRVFEGLGALDLQVTKNFAASAEALPQVLTRGSEIIKTLVIFQFV